MVAVSAIIKFIMVNDSGVKTRNNLNDFMPTGNKHWPTAGMPGSVQVYSVLSQRLALGYQPLTFLSFSASLGTIEMGLF
jgi:hypothetical protein